MGRFFVFAFIPHFKLIALYCSGGQESNLYNILNLHSKKDLAQKITGERCSGTNTPFILHFGGLTVMIFYSLGQNNSKSQDFAHSISIYKNFA